MAYLEDLNGEIIRILIRISDILDTNVLIFIIIFKYITLILDD